MQKTDWLDLDSDVIRLTFFEIKEKTAALYGVYCKKHTHTRLEREGLEREEKFQLYRSESSLPFFTSGHGTGSAGKEMEMWKEIRAHLLPEARPTRSQLPPLCSSASSHLGLDFV